HGSYLACRAEPLQLVMIDEHDQIAQAMMAREDKRLPRRALLPFSIGRETEHAGIPLAEHSAERRTRGKRQAMPKTAGREQDFFDAVARRMARQQRIVLMKKLEILLGKAAERPQRDVERAYGVPLRKHKSVVFAKILVEKHEQCIQRGQIAADMAHPAFEM